MICPSCGHGFAPCLAVEPVRPNYQCTLPEGHDRQHVAHAYGTGLDGICSAWPNENDGVLK